MKLKKLKVSMLTARYQELLHMAPDPGVDPWGAGQRVYSRGLKPILRGVATGHSRPCTLESCGGKKIQVLWPDNKRTWCCTRGLIGYRDGLRIK